MFLKSLTLKGFKSFADATTLQMEPGVTVVVGPNGSGKSNVVDAIAWVLGAQAPSAVRSQKMDDVIFAGTAKRPALGRAEVTLTIDNSAGLLPIEFTEVSVSRTLFRSGESEYSINGASCRLLDVQELLSDAGVGRQQHVIVSQGQIDAVLNARPEDRRAIIEEAAGVLKFRRRKEKAERRLDATEASMLRAQDMLREVRRQLRPLERQADAARRHGALAAELSALQVHLAGREVAALRQRLVTQAAERLSLGTLDTELRSRLAGFDTVVLAAEAELTARGDSDRGDETRRVEQLRERARGLSALIVERRRSMERDRGALMDSGVVATLEAEADRLRSELDSVVGELAELSPAAEQLVAEETAFGEQRQLTLELLDTDAPAQSAARMAAEVRGELRSLTGSLERSAGELRVLEIRLTQRRQRVAAFDADVSALRDASLGAELAETALIAEVEEAEARRVGAEAQHATALAERQTAEANRSRWTARADALRLALESARSAAGADHLVGVEGVLGTLLDLIEVDAGWEPAVEAALGDALQAVVVASPEAGRTALRSLAEADVAGAVLALRHETAEPTSAQQRTSPGVSRDDDAVAVHVRGRSTAVADLLARLLGETRRVSSWNDAVDRSLADPGQVVVTEQGDRFAPSGWRLGVAGGGATAAALDEAQAAAELATATLDTAAGALSAAQTELVEARRVEAEISKRLDAHDAGFSASVEGLARIHTERRELAAEIESVERQMADGTDRMERERARAAELEQMLPALEADEAAEQAAVRERGEAQAAVDREARLLSARRTDLEVRNAGLHERQQFLERRLADTEARLQADVAARADAQQRRLVVQRGLQAVERLAVLIDGHRAAIEVRHGELTELRRRQSDEVRAIAQRLEDTRRLRSTAERALEEQRERARRVDVDDAETRLRLEGVVEALRHDHDLEPDAAEASPLPELPEGTTAPARVRELERELRLLGPINPLALEEFTVLQERHTFVEGQLEDIRTTRRDLMRVIKAVDLEIQTVFGAAFADVSTHFSSLFEMLFPGGTGTLVLTTPDDLLTTGIEVEAKPSGKNVKKLSLLSGGERSLTALAYLFAVFRSRPSPFYVMDEVEAALDDVNLHRFLGLINEFRREAQLLVVSHQKRTMEAGDCLLGVTMQPGGSSKVITERVTAPA